uniref:F5/8 type C domain-containing protein n=1 Tax=Oreochromis niloticus TaxID=8128 RepID=A0A669AXK3_ORENI
KFLYSTQSSLHSIGVAYNAIDGSRTNSWNQASCTYTNADFAPWWRLDLGKAHKVFSVNITNRRDGVPQQINVAEIRIGDSLDNNSNNNPRCTVISSIPAGFTENFQCNGLDGRYVNIVIPGRSEHLILCEVEVCRNCLAEADAFVQIHVAFKMLVPHIRVSLL